MPSPSKNYSPMCLADGLVIETPLSGSEFEDLRRGLALDRTIRNPVSRVSLCTGQLRAAGIFA